MGAMRVAVILVWRPKNFPSWDGRRGDGHSGIPKGLIRDSGAAPYTGIHLASLFPAHWAVTLINEMVTDVNLDLDVHAVFLSTMDYCAPHARFLAMEFRKRGVKVIVGGLFPTLNPDYFRNVVDAVVVGEAEPVINHLLGDLQRNRLEPIYAAQAPADLSQLPPPRYDLVEKSFQVPMAYEATRGCPFTCSFCVLSKIRLPYRRRPISNVIRDIRCIPAGWNWLQRRYVTFWDNNLGADREYFKELCQAMIPLKRIWATETSIDTVTPESARLMGRSGCRIVFIGLESLSEESLANSNKRHNRTAEYKQKISYLHDNGVLVMSIFLVGLDGDSVEYVRELPNLIHEIGVDIPVFSLAAPICGTPFHRSLEEAGRLLPGDLLDGMDGMHLVYKPLGMSPEELEVALFECMWRSYSPARTLRRVARRMRNGFWTGLANASANASYYQYERTLAKVGRARVSSRGAWPDRLAWAKQELDVERLRLNEC